MNEERMLERAAQSWLEAGPTRAPEPAVDAALARIRSTPQDRVFLAAWRFPRMSMPVRIAALLVIGAVALGGVVLLAGGPPEDQAPASPTPSPTASAPASAPASAQPGDAATFTTASEPRLAIDLPTEWLAVENGGEIRLSYLAPDFSTSSATLVRLDRAQVIEAGGGTAAVPDDLLAWLADHPGVSVTSTGSVSIAGEEVPALWVTGRFVPDEPQTEHSLMVTGADRELFVTSGRPAWFAVLDGLGGDGVLVQVNDGDQAAIDRAVSVLQTLRDASP